MGWSLLSLIFLHQNCDPELANDKALPYTAYLVTYEVKKELRYDIVIASKKVDIFDYYWDTYREGLISFAQSEGRVNPKLWNCKTKETKEIKKKR